MRFPAEAGQRGVGGGLEAHLAPAALLEGCNCKKTCLEAIAV